MITLNIYTPERTLLKTAAVTEVTLPASEGQIQILPGHVAMAGTLDMGEFSYPVGEEGKRITGFISTGFFDVENETVNVLAEVLELSSEIDLDRAKAAQSRAEKEILVATEQAQFNKYQLKLQRALIRQQVATKS